jgi:hypothetical protein
MIGARIERKIEMSDWHLASKYPFPRDGRIIVVGRLRPDWFQVFQLWFTSSDPVVRDPPPDWATHWCEVPKASLDQLRAEFEEALAQP